MISVISSSSSRLSIAPRFTAERVHKATSPSLSWTEYKGLVGRVISMHRFDCLIGASTGSKAP